MATQKVRFIYVTGIKAPLFSNVRLSGSWDEEGRFSDRWTVQPMTAATGEDGCPAFTATVDLDAGPAGQTFRWGVRLDGPGGADLWGVMTEVNELSSTERYRSFFLEADSLPQSVRTEVYRLTHNRYLGAQKILGADQPTLQFRVWAPNARNVETVIGSTWRQSDSGKTPQQGSPGQPGRSLPKAEICGGYIDDQGNGTHPGWQPLPMTRDSNGVWSTDPDEPRLRDFAMLDHYPYMYRVTRDDGSVRYRTDIYSRCQIGFGANRPDGTWEGRTLDLDGSVSCSVVIDPDRVTKDLSEPEWPEKNWREEADFWADEFRPDRPMPKRLDNLVIYELHIGALGFGKPNNEPGTLEDALQLLDYLLDLGVNAVELLPLSEFGGGGGGWGYATSHYYSIEYAGGGRDNFKWFIRECHRRGLAVIMDVVYNHYNHSAERAQWMYDSSSHDNNIYYWYEGKPSDYPGFNAAVEEGRKGTGGYVDNLSTGWAPRYHEEIIRKMFIGSAVALALEFHVDGFRMDQTTSIHAYNVLHADGAPVGRANVFGQKLLRELTRTLRFVKPDVMLMAEDHSNWDKVTEPPDQGGLGFDKVWYADFYHHLIGDTDKGSDYAKLIKTAGLGDDRPLAMDYFAGALANSGNHKVVYNESHDEAGNGHLTDRTMVVAVNGPPHGEARPWAESRCRCAAAVTLLSGGTPMFLFGEEVGAEKKFLYGHVLENREDLHGMRRNSGSRLFQFYGDLIRFRSANPGLRTRNVEVCCVHNDNRMLVFRRWGEGQEFLVVASLNNRPFNNPDYRINSASISGGRWREVFNSDSQAYGGDNIGNGGAVIDAQAGSIACVAPANAVVVFQKVG